MVSLWRLVPSLRAQIMFMAVVGGCGCGEEEKTRTTFVCCGYSILMGYPFRTQRLFGLL
jgi:hypothetical protein